MNGPRRPTGQPRRRNRPHEAGPVDRFKVTPDAGILARTVLEAVPFNIPDARNDPRTNPELAARLGTNAFATVPLIAKDRVMGVILVDNLFSQRPITDDDVRFLTLFAHQGGARDRERRSRRRPRRRPEVASRASGQAHPDREDGRSGRDGRQHRPRDPESPRCRRGFARRLMARLPEAMTAERHYGEIIVKEVKRLEKILEEVLVFSRDARPDLVVCDIASLVNEVLSFIEDDCRENGISVTADLPPEPVYTLADPAQVKQALLNLFTNAVQAIPPRRRDHRPPAADPRARGADFDRDRGHGRGDPRRHHGQHLQPVLYDEGLGDRPRSRHYPAHRRGPPQGGDRGRQQTRRGRDVPDSPAGGDRLPPAGGQGGPIVSAKRILVVDDEASIRELYREELSESGYSVETAASARKLSRR